jgi:hypothetical protein
MPIPVAADGAKPAVAETKNELPQTAPAATPAVAVVTTPSTSADVARAVSAAPAAISVVAPAPASAAAAQAVDSPAVVQPAPAAAPVVTASVVQPDTHVSSATITAAVSGQRIYIRVGTFHSRKHARHVAARLKPRDVHIAKVMRHGRRYYRVFIADVGVEQEAENTLASVRSLGYHHARIIVRKETPVRHLARGDAATMVATRGQ